MDPAAVNTQLETNGIIVRQAVLPNVVGGVFDPNVDGPPISGIPSGTAGASYSPDTLEAADSKEKADDHGRVSAVHQAEHKAALEKAQPHPTPATPTPSAPHRSPRPPRGETP